jgi:hypothetical protein
MPGSNVIGIGLVMTSLCLSSVVTAAHDLCATLFRSRGRDLERGTGKPPEELPKGPKAVLQPENP